MAARSSPFLRPSTAAAISTDLRAWMLWCTFFVRLLAWAGPGSSLTALPRVVSAAKLACSCFRAAWRQKRKDGRQDEQRRNVTQEVSALPGVRQCLHCHDGGMHSAGPHGEPDKAHVCKRVAASN